jgi:hypothetical protein
MFSNKEVIFILRFFQANHQNSIKQTKMFDALFSSKIIQSVYKRTYIKSPVELCGSIFFLVELCLAVEAGKLDVE